MKLKTLPIFLAFFCMGFGDAVGPFVGLAKESFQLSNTMAQLIPFVGFIMFGFLSIPMGILQDKKGKKFILLLGLFVAFAGLVLPAIFSIKLYSVFLVTIMLLGAGAATLQVAGNPIMRDVSAPGKYSANLSLAQFIKAIGSLTGPLIPAIAAYFWGANWSVIFIIYSISILITILITFPLKVHETHSDDKKPATFGSCFALLKNPYVLMMVLAIFFYVGAEVSMSSGIPLYLESTFNFDISTMGVLGTSVFFLALTIGRFLGGIVLNWIAPKKFFILTVFIAIIGMLGLFISVKIVALFSVILIGLGYANIFPLVFSIAIDTKPEYSNELSGLMVTAIAGGALIPPLMGMVSDLSNVLIGFLVPLAVIIYITIVAFYLLKH